LSQSAIRGYHKLCFSTLIAVFILILAGGVVRTTGSGMGCPDWPKCFGTWVPPTSIDQLPPDYKTTFSEYREKKNQKFAKYLNAIGLNEKANVLLNNKSILEEADFNASKTWIEYINRLLGVIVGFLILAMAVKSGSLRKAFPKLFYFSLATLIAVIIQGWFGSIVVSTNLTTWTITVHMFLALLIVAFLVYLYHISDHRTQLGSIDPSYRWILFLCIAALLVQIFWGTQVRQAIDRIAAASALRDTWISQLGLEFIIHRSFSWVVLGLHVFLVVKMVKTSMEKVLPLALIVLILGTLLSGAGMAYFSVPYLLQPVHLLIGTMIFGVQLLLMFRLNTAGSKVLI
jgi:heme a synthase